MKVVETFPPLFREINEKFDVRGKPVIYTYGDTVYNPSRITIPPYLMVHERVHSQQQGNEPEYWWRIYLANKDFRLAEELEAHIAELNYRGAMSPTSDREKLREEVATRLSSPIYGNMIDYVGARILLANYPQ